MKTLIIARHGNTFRPGETPTRVGANTDLPLVEEERARGIGKYLKKKGLMPTKVYAAPLQRTMQTAALAVEELGTNQEIIPLDIFTEINYGPDENKIEEDVIARIGKDYLAKEGKTNPSEEEINAKGQEVIDLWNEKALPPEGWHVDVPKLISAWKDFGTSIPDGETILVVSSNGVIRFAPYLTSDYDEFCKTHDIKVATGGVCIFEYKNDEWTSPEWNVKAFKSV